MSSKINIKSYFPVLAEKNKIMFQKHNFGFQSKTLPFPEDNLTLVDIDEVEEAWEEIIKIVKTNELYVSFQLSVNKLVFSRKLRTSRSRRKQAVCIDKKMPRYTYPVDGQLMASFYLDNKKEIELLVCFLNDLTKLGDTISLGYEFFIEI